MQTNKRFEQTFIKILPDSLLKAKLTVYIYIYMYIYIILMKLFKKQANFVLPMVSCYKTIIRHVKLLIYLIIYIHIYNYTIKETKEIYVFIYIFN